MLKMCGVLMLITTSVFADSLPPSNPSSLKYSSSPESQLTEAMFDVELAGAFGTAKSCGNALKKDIEYKSDQSFIKSLADKGCIPKTIRTVKEACNSSNEIVLTMKCKQTTDHIDKFRYPSRFGLKEAD